MAYFSKMEMATYSLEIVRAEENSDTSSFVLVVVEAVEVPAGIATLIEVVVNS